MAWLQIVATAIVCGAIIIDVAAFIVDIAKNNRQDNKCKTNCNSCAFLKRKRHPSPGVYKYYCSKYSHFDKPPIFCADYRKRKEEE